MKRYTINATKDNGKTCIVDEGGGFRLLGAAVESLLEVLYGELGDGDGENGGKGSLRNCRGEIEDTLKAGTVYTYADCAFWVETEEVEDGYWCCSNCGEHIENGVKVVECSAFDKVKPCSECNCHCGEYAVADEESFAVGDKVYWEDPDGGTSSGVYTVASVNGETVAIRNENGSEAEVPPEEIEKIK